MAIAHRISINSQLPGTVWLPDGSHYTSANHSIFSLPVKSERVTTSYGKAIRYTTSLNWSAVK